MKSQVRHVMQLALLLSAAAFSGAVSAADGDKTAERTSAGTSVTGNSFGQQVETVRERIQLHEGQYGPAGAGGDEALPSSAVRDRDFDRYVKRLAIEIKAHNAQADRDPAGFQ